MALYRHAAWQAILLASVLGCESDLDCSLNGECTVAGVCDCDAAWEGEQCERFAQLPVPASADIKQPNVSTWGSGTLQRRVNGQFHMYAAEFVGHCGVTTWQTNSLVAHFTASEPSGPWERRGVALPVWSHCPSAALAPNGTVVMWAFAGGRSPKTGPDAWGNRCIGGASPCGDVLSRYRGRPTHEDMLTRATSSLPLFVSAAGPDGPWEALAATIDEAVSYSIAAPWFLPNGTAFWVLQAACPSTMRDHASGTCGTILRGESWEGPYSVIARDACAIGEDHSLYIDARGFHCLTHRFSNASLPPGPFDAMKDGGHAFSLDGSDGSWFCADGKGGHGECQLASPIAYNSTIVYAHNGVNKFGTRERPHILFDGSNPVALTTSVQHCQAPDVADACTADPRSCNQSNLLCHNQWPGYMDRSWTSVVPLRTTKQ
eukprot:g2992.t1